MENPARTSDFLSTYQWDLDLDKFDICLIWIDTIVFNGRSESWINVEHIGTEPSANVANHLQTSSRSKRMTLTQQNGCFASH